MARTIVQPITDTSECTQYYLVQYKLNTQTAYNQLYWYDDNIEIRNLLDDSVYDVRITRYCCNGGISAPLILSIDTTTLSPQLDAPANFTLLPDSPPVSGQLEASWDIVANAETYHGILSEFSDFSVIAQTFTTVDPTISISISSLTPATLYYGKVLARAVGYADSIYSNTDSEIAP